MSKQEYWEKQSKSFDESADYYDQFRPGYPDQLIRELVSRGELNQNSRILEVGAGSGKATRQFVEMGLRLTCIEPGEKLARIGAERFKGQAEFIISRFEDWSGPSNYYDLIFSAQAFHWVPKPLGYSKCYELLRPGGCIGLFWNFYLESSSALDAELKELFQQYPLAYLDSKAELAERIDQHRRSIQESGFFDEVEVVEFPWTEVMTAGEYVGFIKTGNGYLTLEPEQQREAETKVRRKIENHGGTVLRSYVCTLFLAWKVGTNK